MTVRSLRRDFPALSLSPTDRDAPDRDDLRRLDSLRDLPKSRYATRPCLTVLQPRRPRPLIFSHIEVFKMVESIATELRESGVRPATPCAFLLPPSLESVVYFLALQWIGAVAVPVDPDLPVHLLHRVLTTVSALTVVTPYLDDDDRQDNALYARVADIASELGIVHWMIARSTNRGVYLDMCGVRAGEHPAWAGGAADFAFDPADPSFILPSPTSPTPPATHISHGRAASAAMLFANCYDLSELHATLLHPPLYNIHGLVAALATLSTGGNLILAPDLLDAEAIASHVANLHVDWVTVDAHTAAELLPKLEANGTQKNSLSFIRLVGPPVSTPLQTLNSDVLILPSYGTTETVGIVTTNSPTENEPATSGVAVGECEIAVFDSKLFAPVETDVPGLIAVTGGHAHVAASVDDDVCVKKPFISMDDKVYFLTGDIGWLDATGRLILSPKDERVSEEDQIVAALAKQDDEIEKLQREEEEERVSREAEEVRKRTEEEEERVRKEEEEHTVAGLLEEERMKAEEEARRNGDKRLAEEERKKEEENMAERESQEDDGNAEDESKAVDRSDSGGKSGELSSEGASAGGETRSPPVLKSLDSRSKSGSSIAKKVESEDGSDENGSTDGSGVNRDISASTAVNEDGSVTSGGDDNGESDNSNGKIVSSSASPIPSTSKSSSSTTTPETTPISTREYSGALTSSTSMPASSVGVRLDEKDIALLQDIMERLSSIEENQKRLEEDIEQAHRTEMDNLRNLVAQVQAAAERPPPPPVVMPPVLKPKRESSADMELMNRAVRQAVASAQSSSRDTAAAAKAAREAADAAASAAKAHMELIREKNKRGPDSAVEKKIVVSLDEVEDAIRSHPSIERARAFGRPDARYGTEIFCVVSLKLGARISEPWLKLHAQSLLPAPYVPRQFFYKNELQDEEDRSSLALQTELKRLSEVSGFSSKKVVKSPTWAPQLVS